MIMIPGLLFIVYCLLFIILSWLKPKWALFLICALLPTYQIRFQVFGLPTTLLEIMILILFLLQIPNLLSILRSSATAEDGQIYKLRVKQYSQITIEQFKNWWWLIFVWLGVGLLAVFTSPDKYGALGHWRAYFLEPILLLTVILNLSQNHSKQRIYPNTPNSTNFTKLTKNMKVTKSTNITNLIIYALSFSALYCAVWAIAQKIWGGGMLSLEVWQYPLKPIWRVTGPFPQANFLGLFLGPVIILAFGKLIGNWKLKIGNWRRLSAIGFWLLVVVTSLTAIVLARSEGAILGILAGLIFLIFIYLKKRQKIIFLLILLVVSCWLLIASPWRNYLWERITFRDLSGQLRLNIWRATLNLLKDQPIFGAGLRGYQTLISQYQKPFYLPTGEVISIETHPYPHNLFLALWTELGLFGLAVFLIIIFQFFKFGFQKLFRNLKLEIGNSDPARSEKILVVAVLSAMVAILIHGMVDTPYFKNDLSILFWLIIGLMMVSNYKE